MLVSNSQIQSFYRLFSQSTKFSLSFKKAFILQYIQKTIHFIEFL